MTVQNPHSHAQRPIVIGLCAGEASGDLLGAHLMEALLQHHPHIRFVGIGEAYAIIGLAKFI